MAASTAAGHDSFEQLVETFSQRVAELKNIALLRVQDDVKNLWRSQLAELNAQVHTMEQRLKDVEAHIEQDANALCEAEAVISAAEKQAAYIQHIKEHLPQHLPTAPPAAASSNVLQPRSSNVQASAAAAAQVPASSQPAPAASKPAASKATAGAHQVKTAPRRFVTQAEMASLASYIRGRLTQEKVNAALDEVCRHAEVHARDMAAARAGTRSRTDRKLLTTHLYEIHMKEGVRGRWWFMESDCRNGQHIKLDRTGRAMLTALRSLGRLQEVRLTVQGERELIYVLV